MDNKTQTFDMPRHDLATGKDTDIQDSQIKTELIYLLNCKALIMNLLILTLPPLITRFCKRMAANGLEANSCRHLDRPRSCSGLVVIT